MGICFFNHTVIVANLLMNLMQNVFDEWFFYLSLFQAKGGETGTFGIFCMDDCLSESLFLRLKNEESFKGNPEDILLLAMKKNY